MRSRAWKKLRPVLLRAHRLLLRRYGRYIGTDSRGHFDIADAEKAAIIRPYPDLGSFDAWTDRVLINLQHDPVGTAVHELLHANAFSDDWLPRDIGKRDTIVSFRGLEVQVASADKRKVKRIYHRALNEGVTELLTLEAYRRAVPAYTDLLSFASSLRKAIGLKNLMKAYFSTGYPCMQAIASICRFNLKRLDMRAEATYWHSA